MRSRNGFATLITVAVFAAAQLSGQEYQRVKNLRAHSYLNNNEKDRGGALQVTPVEAGWWSAQWVLEKMPPNRTFRLKNRWTEEYLVSGGDNVVKLGNIQSNKTDWWVLEVTATNSNTGAQSFSLMNFSTRLYLTYNEERNGTMMTAGVGGSAAVWSLEKENQTPITRNATKTVPQPEVQPPSKLTAAITAAAVPDALTKQDSVIIRDLGRGYNGAGSYANERYLLKRIFALEGRQHYAYTPMAGTSEIITKSGRTATEFSNQLAVNVEGGVTGLFSATVKAGVEQSSSGSDSTSFAQVDDTTVLYTARLSPDAQPSPEALNDLNNMEPKQVIATYGTHYTNFLEFGGHLSFVTFVEERERTNSLDIKVEAEAAYGIARGKAGAEAKGSNTAKSMSQRGRFFCSGGSSNLNERTQLDAQLYTDWKNSVRRNPSIAGFGPDTVSDGLRGIWTVPGLKPGRAAVLKRAARAYLKQRGTGVFDKPGIEAARKNMDFILKGEDGLYLGGGRLSQNYWYATMGPSQGQIHNFGLGGEPLLSGHIVKLVTANPDSDYPAFNRLMAPKSGATCYYSHDNGDYENWQVWKDGKNLHAGEPIFFGDTIVVESSAYRGKFLRPSGSPWVGITDSYKWTLQKP